MFDNALVLAHSITTDDAILCQAPKYELKKGDMVVIHNTHREELAIVDIVANVYESSNDIYDLFMKYLEEIAGEREPLPKVVALMFKSVMKYPEEGNEKP